MSLSDDELLDAERDRRCSFVSLGVDRISIVISLVDVTGGVVGLVDVSGRTDELSSSSS